MGGNYLRSDFVLRKALCFLLFYLLCI